MNVLYFHGHIPARLAVDHTASQISASFNHFLIGKGAMLKLALIVHLNRLRLKFSVQVCGGTSSPFYQHTNPLHLALTPAEFEQ